MSGARLISGGEVIMYKKQLTLQKIACLLAIVAAGVCFAYSLGVMTDLYDSLYTTMLNPADLSQTFVPGSIIYYDMQEFNKTLLSASIGMLLASGLLYLTNTQVRRKYYIGNFLATLVYVCGALGVSGWLHKEIAMYKEQFLTTVDFAALESFAKMFKSLYTESTFWFDVHYVVMALLGITSVILVVNAIWKVVLMKAENRLIEEGKRKEATV